MEIIKFDDRLKVERVTGYNEWDEATTDTVFDGYGRYQQGGQVYTGFLVRNSVLFIPKDVKLKENDEVFVTLTNDRRLRGVIGTIRNIEMPITHERVTRMEIKQVTDVAEEESEKGDDNTDSDDELEDA